MNKIKRLPFLAAPLLAALALSTIPVTQTGCKIVNGTNTFDVAAAAGAITDVLGPVVVFEENADPATITDFQTASAGLGVLLSNNTFDADALKAKLEPLGKTALVKLAIDVAVGLYSTYLGQIVSQGLSQTTYVKPLLQAFKDALDKGVKANTKRVKARRAAYPSVFH